MTTTDAAPGCPVRDDFDPLSERYLADPHAVLAGLPAAGEPVFYAPSIGYYVVTRYADMAVTQLARRYPRLRLVPGQRLSFHPNISFRGPQTLLVRPG